MAGLCVCVLGDEGMGRTQTQKAVFSDISQAELKGGIIDIDADGT